MQILLIQYNCDLCVKWTKTNVFNEGEIFDVFAASRKITASESYQFDILVRNCKIHGSWGWCEIYLFLYYILWPWPSELKGNRESLLFLYNVKDYFYPWVLCIEILRHSQYSMRTITPCKLAPKSIISYIWF